MKKITISIVALLSAALLWTLSAFACSGSTQATAEEGSSAQAVSEQPNSEQPISLLTEDEDDDDADDIDDADDDDKDIEDAEDAEDVDEDEDEDDAEDADEDETEVDEIDEETDYESALYRAAEKGTLEEVQNLINQGANVNGRTEDCKPYSTTPMTKVGAKS